jgi:hypothetical protein
MVAVARPLAERVARDGVRSRDRGVNRARRYDVGRVEQLRRFEELARVDQALTGLPRVA